MDALVTMGNFEETRVFLEALEEATSIGKTLSDEEGAAEEPDFLIRGEGYAGLVKVLKAMGQYGAMESLTAESLKYSEQESDGISFVSRILFQVEVAENTGDLTRAETLLKDLLVTAENSGEVDDSLVEHVRCRLARVLHEQGQTDESNRMVSQIADVPYGVPAGGDPLKSGLEIANYPIAPLLCENAAIDLDVLEASVRAALENINCDDPMLESIANESLAIVYNRKGQSASAAQYCEAAIRACPANAPFQMRLLEERILGLLTVTSHPMDAERVLRDMLARADRETAPGHAERGYRRISLARFLIDQQIKPDEARGLLEEAQTILPQRM